MVTFSLFKILGKQDFKRKGKFKFNLIRNIEKVLNYYVISLHLIWQRMLNYFLTDKEEAKQGRFASTGRR